METVCEINKSEPKIQNYCETLSRFKNLEKDLYETKNHLLDTVREILWDTETLCEGKKFTEYWQSVCVHFDSISELEGEKYY